MMFYAIGEPEYKTSNWYKDILDGLLNEKRQKRFSLTMLEDIRLLDRRQVSQEDIIFVIGTNSEWLEKTLMLPNNPERIEAFDISNLGSTGIVAAMTG